jgi:hypothetical protein
MEGRLYFFNKPDPNRPIELKYLAEFGETQKWFEKEEDAKLFLFDNGIRKYQYLTKKLSEYTSLKNLQTFELWHIKNRVGYVTNGYQKYYDVNNNVQQKRAIIWRFIGYGRSCFAETQEELKDKVLSLINFYNDDLEECDHNTYPFFTRYHR